MSHPAQLTDPAAIRRFATAGRARFTLVSERTGQRFTYRVTAKKGSPDFFFVSLLTGPENSSDYTYLGCLTGGRFTHDRRLRIGADAPSRRAFTWFWGRVGAGHEAPECECWHEGRCGKCGRALTVPESIASGLGPICAAA
jgi:hypothetical protein